MGRSHLFLDLQNAPVLHLFFTCYFDGVSRAANAIR